MRIIKILNLSILILVGCVQGNNSNKEKLLDDENKIEERKFVWDFNKKKKLTYSFFQTVEVENKTRKNKVESKVFITNKGSLIVMVKENQLADLILTDIEMIMYDYESPFDSVINNPPKIVIKNMSPDGNFNNINSAILFDKLLPLPSFDLKNGGMDKIAMQMPFNANGSKLFAEGFNTIVFNRFETIDNRKCVVFNGKIDISDLKIPKELKGRYEYSTTGSATYFFDIENHFYVGANIQMLMEVLMDSEIKKEKDSGMYMEMKSDIVYKIRLEKIEE